MIVCIRDIEQIGEDVWNDFVERHPLGTVYHHSAWHRVIEDTYGYRGSYCTIEEDGRLAAGLPFVLIHNLPLRRRLVSYPYSDTCDPLVHGPEELEAIMRVVRGYAASRRIGSAEIRTGRLSGSLYRAQGDSRYCNFVLALDAGKEKLFRSFHKNCVQRGIRKAESSRLEVVEGKDVADMKRFYDLHVGTRKRHGVPPQPFRFFRNLWVIFHPRKMISLLFARTNGVDAAAVISLRFKDSVYYKFAAGEKLFFHKRPNHLLIWRLIEKAVSDGYRYLDFGRTFTGDRGLMQWKRRWGAVPARFEYVYPFDNTGGRFNQQGSRINRILSGILRNMPCFIVRMSGELFYRYLA